MGTWHLPCRALCCLAHVALKLLTKNKDWYFHQLSTLIPDCWELFSAHAEICEINGPTRLLIMLESEYQSVDSLVQGKERSSIIPFPIIALFKIVCRINGFRLYFTFHSHFCANATTPYNVPYCTAAGSFNKCATFLSVCKYINLNIDFGSLCIILFAHGIFIGQCKNCPFSFFFS